MAHRASFMWVITEAQYNFGCITRRAAEDNSAARCIDIIISRLPFPRRVADTSGMNPLAGGNPCG
jgi:hypothetical protein